MFSLPGDLIPGKALWKGSAGQAAPFLPLGSSLWGQGTPGESTIKPPFFRRSG